ncbi:MAG: hypothetical protein ABW200_04140 [Hyphomicrobiaceae bacterium]
MARSSRHLLARLGAAAALALVSTAALAQERLIMPYSCSAYGGRVELTPSRDESYRIYGQREERPYTVCSPINPNACRTWLLHRFDLDCGGERVDWLSVVEAASEQTTGRAWIENGRLRMRMNQYWSRDGGQDDDPCPRWRRHGPYGDDCAGRGGSRRRGSVVEMPPGFAPAFGLPIRFVGSDLPPMPADPRGGPEASAKGAHSWSARVEPPRDMPARDMPGREPFAKDPFAKDPIAKDPSAKTPQVTGATTTTPGTPSGTPKPAARPATPTDVPADPSRPEQAKPKPPEPAREVAAAEPATSSGSAGTGSIVPRIINRPAAEQTSPGNGMVSKPTTPYVERVPEPVPVRVAEAKPTIEPAAPSKPSITFSAKPSTVSEAAPGHSTFTALTPSATTQALVGFAGLVAIALGLFAWTRHREQLSLAAAGGREFGSVNFAKGDAKPSVWSRGSALPRPQAARATPPQTTKTPAPTDVQVPRTREEACEVLGASPDAGEAAIKKIVEGLRQSWHPDLATSEVDRQLREQRTTQINVAWEILSGKRRPA